MVLAVSLKITEADIKEGPAILAKRIEEGAQFVKRNIIFVGFARTLTCAWEIKTTM